MTKFKDLNLQVETLLIQILKMACIVATFMYFCNTPIHYALYKTLTSQRTACSTYTPKRQHYMALVEQTVQIKGFSRGMWTNFIFY